MLAKTNIVHNHIPLIIVLILLFLIYAPSVGRGFVLDDWIWLDHAAPWGKVNCVRFFTDTTGFYRPLISLSFALQFQVLGLNPLPYGWFNLLLHLANVWLVYLLLLSLNSFKKYAWFVAALFGLNFKGPMMAVEWISGRTSLLYTFFLLLCFYSYLKIKKPRYKFLVGMFYFFALLSKETAIVAPIFVFLYFLARELKKTWINDFKTLIKQAKTALAYIKPFWTALIIYLLLRINSNAFTPLNAPPYYQYSLSAKLFAVNLVEYFFRSGLLDIVIILWLLLLAWIFRKSKGPMEPIHWSVFFTGSLWFLVFLLPVILIHVRSDLYTYLPQLGVHLMAAPIIVAKWNDIRATIKTRSILWLAIAPICLFFLVYLGKMTMLSASYFQRGIHATSFSNQLASKISTISKKSNIFVVDLAEKNCAALVNYIDYSYTSIMRLYYPHHQFQGEIISWSQAICIPCQKDNTRFLFWKNSQLTGPYRCGEVKQMKHNLN